ncbi:hypothetical protein [Haloechinothrix halophila]|uniref:hypothetical protein n=1 Tax=Haloechinothrix halophila TaxID=1069073 RepID=UPI0003F861F5|nr:hypothetical protein [Haloechinothrix halophila]
MYRNSVVSRVIGAMAGVAAIASVAACGGSGHDSPEDLGNAIATAANDQDLAGIKELTCEKNKDSITEEFDVETAREKLNAPDLEFSAEFVSAETDGDKSTLTFKLALENMPQELKDAGAPDSFEPTEDAIKEDGNWVMC